MRIKRVTTTVVLCGLAAFGTTDVAFGEAPGDRAARARAAGIEVSPSAAAEMDRAPGGSCFQDPTQAKCGGVKALRVANNVVQDDGATVVSTLPAVARSRTRARAAASASCILRADYPFFAAGYAQGSGNYQCTGAVTYMEAYFTLYDFISTGKRVLNVAQRTKNSYGQVSANVTSDCNHAVNSRLYEMESRGYFRTGGVLYSSGRAFRQDSFVCPY